jgi:hypothetical protein
VRSIPGNLLRLEEEVLEPAPATELRELREENAELNLAAAADVRSHNLLTPTIMAGSRWVFSRH